MSEVIQNALTIVSLGQPCRTFTQCLYPCRNLFFFSEVVKVSNMPSLKNINTKMQVLNWIWIAAIVQLLKPGHANLQRKQVYLWVDLSNVLGMFNSWTQGYFGIDKVFIWLNNFNLVSYHGKDENFLILCFLKIRLRAAFQESVNISWEIGYHIRWAL